MKILRKLINTDETWSTGILTRDWIEGVGMFAEAKTMSTKYWVLLSIDRLLQVGLGFIMVEQWTQA